MAKQSGMLFNDEAAALKELVQELSHEAVVVNVGSGLGYSTSAMLEERPDLRIVSIDTKGGTSEAARLEKLGLPSVVSIAARSQIVGKMWLPRSNNMVYLDGSHEKEDVEEDIRVWLPTIKHGGVLAVHDHSPPLPRKQTPRQLQHEAWVTEVCDKLLGDFEVVLHENRLKAYRIERL